MSDPELRELLRSELGRYRSELARPGCEPGAIRKLLHAAKGSAAMAGERALAEALSRLEKRARDGDEHATDRAVRLLEAAICNLQQGKAASVETWPRPPEDLRPATVPPSSLPRYSFEMRDRIALLDQALAEDQDPAAACDHAFRHVHTIKGAALSVGDDVLVWFCHGLETRLRAARESRDAARQAIDELTRWRAVLAEMVDDPARGLDTLRSMTGGGGSTHPPEGAAPRVEAAAHAEQSWLRVPGASVDRVLERIGRLSVVNGEYRTLSESSRHLARRLRTHRARLLEAQRLIGPPRPWGAPAAAVKRIEDVSAQLTAAAELLEASSTRSRLLSRSIRQDVAQTQADLGAMRQATMEFVFEPARAAAEAVAQRQGRLVHVSLTGASVPVGRRLAEALVDPVVQLARNAVAHGIESASARRAAGKPDVGAITLAAEVRGVQLEVRVRDDGAGVDVEAVRERTVQAGVLSEEQARGADDDLLMHMLFVPGLTTRERADLLAGRGVGLDLVQHAVRGLGGAIRMINRPRHGLEAVIEVPLSARGVVSVLWVSSLQQTFALSSSGVRRVSMLEQGAPIPPALAHCIEPSRVGQDSPGYVIEVGRDDPDRISFGVATVRTLEQVAVRPLPPLVAAAGPYAGVIVTPAGRPAVLLDPLRVAELLRVRARPVATP